MGTHQVLDVAWLVPGTIRLRFTREKLDFQPGQYLLVGVPGGDLREYSIFSRPSDPWLEILVRVIPEGLVSSQLARLVSGDRIAVRGPQGGFLLPSDPYNGSYLLVATGTGIAPFHAMVGTYPELEYQLYHGVRYATECYVRHAFAPERCHACLSREDAGAGDYAGRVTQVLYDVALRVDTACYLCGSCDMIYDMFALLQTKGIPRGQIHAETYY